MSEEATEAAEPAVEAPEPAEHEQYPPDHPLVKTLGAQKAAIADQKAAIADLKAKLEESKAEAAKLGESAAERDRLEAERQALASKVETLQRDAINRLAEADGLKPAALWAAGTELSGLLTEVGTIDQDMVANAIRATRDALGIPYMGLYAPDEGRIPAPPALNANELEEALKRKLGIN